MCSDTFCYFLSSAGLSTLAHFQHALFVKHFPTHFASLPDSGTPADPLPPACDGPWRVEIEPPLLLTLKGALASGLPGPRAWALQGSLAPMLGTEALVVVGVPSSHCEALTAVAREPSRERISQGSSLEDP